MMIIGFLSYPRVAGYYGAALPGLLPRVVNGGIDVLVEQAANYEIICDVILLLNA